MLKVVRFILINLMIIQISVCYAGWRSEHERGWHWYEQGNPEPQKESTEGKGQNSYAHQLSNYRKRGEELRAKAILEKTPASVKDLMLWEKTMWDNSEKFGTVWQAVLRENPQLDYSVTHPTTQFARHLYIDEQKKAIVASIQQIRNDYGLMFFFKESCSYCHGMAPIITSFAERYGFALHSISLDGGKISSLRRINNDNGISQRFNVTMVPAVIAVNPSTGEYFPIANGAVSQQELEERLFQIAEYHSSLKGAR